MSVFKDFYQVYPFDFKPIVSSEIFRHRIKLVTNLPERTDVLIDIYPIISNLSGGSIQKFLPQFHKCAKVLFSSEQVNAGSRIPSAPMAE